MGVHTDKISENHLKGEPVSEGIAIGYGYKFEVQRYKAEEAYCSLEGTVEEWEKLQHAFRVAVDELRHLQEVFSQQSESKAMIFAAHQELIEDEELLETVRLDIFEEHYTAEYAVEQAFSFYAEVLSKVDDPLISARTADLGDVKNRLLRILSGEKEKDLSNLPDKSIIIAKDLLPSDTAMMDATHALGIITEEGSRTSHTAIIARSMHLPAVLGVKNAMKEIGDGQMLVLDATTGTIVLSSEKGTLHAYEQKRTAFRNRRLQTSEYLNAIPCTQDGVRIEVGLNIGNVDSKANYEHASFIGLFRSEFLYMESDHMPSEEEQFLAYKQVLECAGDKVVTLRTLDIGGDKVLPYFSLPQEKNPFLGQRALRLCFSHEEIFHTQLRAAYRAAAFGKLQIMFPMVGSLNDFRKAKEMALAVREELCSEGLNVPEVPLGVMIEIPSIAIMADLIAQEADFASVGTNDLCQYMCAADRMNADVTQYYQSFSPAMLRVMKEVVNAFDKNKKPVCVCGEMGGDPMGAMLLIGLGYRKISMSESNLAPVKEMICTHTLQEIQQATDAALQCGTEEEVKAVIGKLLFPSRHNMEGGGIE